VSAEPTVDGGYHLREATLADRPAILPLLVGLAPTRDQQAHIAWLYDGNPAGPALTWLAVDSVTGEFAGITSYFPWRLLINGRETRAAIGGDGYVSPKYRRRGIAAALHGALRAQMQSNGMAVMFGAPAAMNRTPLKASGSEHITEMVRHVRPLAARGLNRHLRPLDPIVRPLLAPRPARARLEPVTGEDRRVDEVWEMTRDEYDVATVRDARFYSWRFVRSPSQVQRPYVVVLEGRPIGVCALETRGDHLGIIDLCATRRHWGAALGAIAQAATGVASIELRLLREDARARRVARYGFIARDGAEFLVVTPPPPAGDLTLHDPRRWTYLEGDVDIDRLA
jgi:GNAT superfamily N-acetyltransferase